MKYFSLILILINLILSSLNEIIPDSFDSREKWPNCISKINNQGNCGACYAFSVSEAFSMRYCIRNNLTKIINFSAQNLINCLSGCQGEFPDVAWDYIKKNGITSNDCLSYKNRQNNCNLNCDSSNIQFKKYFSGEAIFLEDENSIKKEIMKNGPVTSMMNIYSDYYDYKSGIYSHSSGNSILGFHAIVIIGWGIENDIKYWIIQDSYGELHGENGYLRIKIGDECGAGATAFCDEQEGYYKSANGDNNDKKETYNNQKLIFSIIFILFIFIIVFILKK